MRLTTSIGTGLALILLGALGACATVSRPEAGAGVPPRCELTMTRGALRAAISSTNPLDEEFVLTASSVRARDGEEDYRAVSSASRAKGIGDGPLTYGTGEGFHASGDVVTVRYQTFDRAGRPRSDSTRTITVP